MNSKRGNLIIVKNIVNATQLYRYVVQTFSDLSDCGGVDITRANEASSSAGGGIKRRLSLRNAESAGI